MTSSEPRNIEDLTSEEFVVGDRLRLEPITEEFIITHIGRISYAVSLRYGYSYTRPQLIQKYANVGATYVVTQHEGV